MIKVLIVDDEYIMRQGLKYMIDWEQEGFEIVGEATNGAEALQFIETLTPQIIICDIVMPQLDGVDFSEAVHRMYPRIQTIILSGYDKYEYVRHTLINGVVDYILKPTLNPEELHRVLQKAVDRIPGARMGSTSGEVHYEHLVERYLLGHDNEWNRELNARCFPASYLRIFAVTSGRETDNDRNISEVLNQKLQREVASVISGGWIISNIKARPEQEGLWRIAPIPVLTGNQNAVAASNVGGSGWYVLKNSVHSEAATDFIIAMFGENDTLLDQLITEIGIVPAVKNPTVLTNYGREDPYFGGQQVTKLLTELETRIPVVNYGSKTYEIEDILEAEFQNVLVDDDLQTCLHRVQEKAEAVARE